MKQYLAVLFFLLGVFAVAVAGGQEAVQEAIPGWTAPLLWSAGQAATDAAKAPSGPRREGLQALPTAPLPLIGITPCRIADTRDGGRPPGYGPPSLPGGAPRNFTLTGQCGIAGTAQAVSLNVTVTNTAGPGFILIYPQGGAQPLVSTLNYVAGQTVANAAVVPLGTGGGITVIAGVSGTDLVLDTNGYYDNSGVITSITPGTGLSGGGTSGTVSLGIANGGVGTTQLSATGSSNGQALVSNGSAVSWGSPASFTGALSGEVTGTQGATVVSNAVPANTPNAIVRRDGSGNFSAQTVTLGGNLALPVTGGSTAGVITSGVDPFLHNFGTFNTFLGANAGNFTMTGFDNTASGAGALTSNTTGVDNTASGFNALHFNTTGSANAASGTSALVANTTGSSNTAMGRSALENNTTGNNNTATGVVALFFNDIGSENTAIGLNALFRNTAGISNTASGAFALDRNTTGGFNTASGRSALFFNTTGGSNTASGYQALFNNTTGSSNIAIGSGAGMNLTTGDNNIDIGNSGQNVPPDANTIRIGTVGTHTATFIAGIFTAMVPGGSPVVVSSAGQLGLIPSSRRFKEDIQEIGQESDGLMRLRPVAFRYRTEIDPTRLTQYGLIAEEVAGVYPDLVVYDRDGGPETVRYHLLVPMLLNEVQKDRKTITDLKARLERLEALMSESMR